MKEEGDTPPFPPPHPHLLAPATLGGTGTAASERKRTRRVPPTTQPLEVDNVGGVVVEVLVMEEARKKLVFIW